MPTIFLRTKLLTEPVKNEKNKFFVRTVVELYGTPIDSVNEILNTLQYLKFANLDNTRSESFDFQFSYGSFKWISNTSIVQVRGKKDSIYDDDNDLPDEPIDELWVFTMLPYITDLIIGKKWRIVSYDNDFIVFFRAEARRLPNPNNSITPISVGDFNVTKKKAPKKKSKYKSVSFEGDEPKITDKKKEKVTKKKPVNDSNGRDSERRKKKKVIVESDNPRDSLQITRSKKKGAVDSSDDSSDDIEQSAKHKKKKTEDDDPIDSIKVNRRKKKRYDTSDDSSDDKITKRKKKKKSDEISSVPKSKSEGMIKVDQPHKNKKISQSSKHN